MRRTVGSWRRIRFGARVSTFVLATVVAISACDSNPAGPSISQGEPFPTLSLETLGGEPHSLRVGRGRVWIVNVWAPWCAPCVAEMPSLSRLSRELDSERFAVIGITDDTDRFLVEEFLRKHQVAFPSYIDPASKNIIGLLAVTTFPETLVVGREGSLLERVKGERVWDGSEMKERLERAWESGRLDLRTAAE